MLVSTASTLLQRHQPRSQFLSPLGTRLQKERKIKYPMLLYLRLPLSPFPSPPANNATKIRELEEAGGETCSTITLLEEGRIWSQYNNYFE